MGYVAFTDGVAPTAGQLDALHAQTVRVCESRQDRDTKIPSPTAGMVAYCTDYHELYVFSNGSWRNYNPHREVYVYNGAGGDGSSFSLSLRPGRYYRFQFVYRLSGTYGYLARTSVAVGSTAVLHSCRVTQMYGATNGVSEPDLYFDQIGYGQKGMTWPSGEQVDYTTNNFCQVARGIVHAGAAVSSISAAVNCAGAFTFAPLTMSIEEIM